MKGTWEIFKFSKLVIITIDINYCLDTENHLSHFKIIFKQVCSF